MLRRGDVLILREKEWRTGQGSILVTVTAVGDRRYDEGDWLSLGSRRPRLRPPRQPRRRRSHPRLQRNSEGRSAHCSAR
ncbi:hypothetical protein GCM10010124_35030 [Pilimelia terevasa]|uniref:Uncharacterized protein n=1 Tax=Pilimelia terevasa TaxID=53372 RepID=A0A8J3BPN2_9ACTN|nr:hypothetical protein GCM10010124_35030 [Pilimelia terevasa]